MIPIEYGNRPLQRQWKVFYVRYSETMFTCFLDDLVSVQPKFLGWNTYAHKYSTRHPAIKYLAVSVICGERIQFIIEFPIDTFNVGINREPNVFILTIEPLAQWYQFAIVVKGERVS